MMVMELAKYMLDVIPTGHFLGAAFPCYVSVQKKTVCTQTSWQLLEPTKVCQCVNLSRVQSYKRELYWMKQNVKLTRDVLTTCP